MNLLEAFEIKEKEVLSFVGAGGKTTFILAIANEIKKINKPIIITTTTHMYQSISSIIDADESKLCKMISSINKKFHPLMLGTGITGDGKIRGVSPEGIDQIAKLHNFPFILVEADGAKRKSIKAFASHEPLIPSCTTKVIVVIGLDCLDQVLDERYAHRIEIIKELTQADPGCVIDEKMIEKLIIADGGLLKGSENIGDIIILFNKADSGELVNRAQQMGENLLEKGRKIRKIIIGKGLPVCQIIKTMERP